MSYLSQGYSWGEAVNNTQRLMSKGKESIVAELQGEYGNLEILDRIKNQDSIEHELMAYWGSLVYSE
ncbi:hypothetical protein [Cytobacillus firmus]|uniref:hypothetical protein n=1 Tax=Cytobacillus firmus TaxID=1399 RepID=UPI001C8F0280|nr:hypothetical protein [Cytobacillus firmus]MBX9972035.1 hypothetical protein [Cytobacillus firmus]